MRNKFVVLGLLSMLLLGAFVLSSVTATHASAAPVQSKVTPFSVRPATISQGTSHHDLVRIVQNDLNDFNNAGLTVDGSFGPLTKAAVINWQNELGLKVDGIVGPQTWSSLGEC